MMRETIVIAGALAQKPNVGGHTWVFLQYLLGLRRLGWDVLFLDSLGPETCVDASAERCPLDHSINLSYLADVMQRFELDGSWALLGVEQRCIGATRQEVLDRTKRSA